MIDSFARIALFAAIRATMKRVKAREQQLVAWRDMLGARTVTRTRIALGIVDALRIVSYLLVVMQAVRSEMDLPFAVAIMAGLLCLEWEDEAGGTERAQSENFGQ